MQYDVLIVGQGLAGTFLSWYLQQAGLRILVIDQGHDGSASQAASGVINPVTGRRLVKTWMIDELLVHARQVYHSLSEELGLPLLTETALLDFFPAVQMRLAFEERVMEGAPFLRLPADQADWSTHFQYDFGYGRVEPVYIIQLRILLEGWRKVLQARGSLLEETFDTSLLRSFEDRVEYKSIQAAHLIFCEGAGQASAPYFSNLPFAPNKGEALWVEIPGLPADYIYKKGYSLVPWSPGIFWLGSTYQWSFSDAEPTSAFRESTNNWLQQNLKHPFKILDHQASVRPATLERRPFVGFHPLYPRIGLLNGMGTKGCSLAPYFAWQLTRHILAGESILPDASVQRFRSVLSRPSL